MFATKDLHGTRGYAGSYETYSPEALQFMALIHPWIRASGSALDVEEAMFQMDLPTSYADWSNMSKPEIQIALGIAKLFNAMARVAFVESAPANEATQIVPAIGPYVSANHTADAPLQFALNIKDGSARDATAIEFDSAPAAYAALTTPGIQNIATLNQAIRDAGLLGVGEDAVEVGNNRVVVRREVAEYLLSSSLLDSNYRNGIPWLDAIDVQVFGDEAEVTVNAGTVTPDLVLYNSADSTSQVIISRFIAGAPDTVRVKEVIGTAPAATDVYVSGDLTVNVTFDTVLSQVNLLGGTLTIKSGDPNDAAASTNGSPYPFLSTVLTNTLAGESAAVGYAFARGVFDASTPGGAVNYTREAIREDSRRRLEFGLTYLAAAYELVSRGTVTSTLSTWSAIQTALRAAGFYATAAEAMSGGQRITVTYAAGNGTALVVNEVASIGNVRAIVTRVDGNGTSGTADLAVFLGKLDEASTGTMTAVAGHSSTYTAASVSYGLAAFLGDPNTISHAGAIQELTPSGELGLKHVCLGAAHMMLLGGGGSGLIAAGAAHMQPAVTSFINDKRHCFQVYAQAMLEKIEIDNAADSVLFANGVAALEKLGWPSWVTGTVDDRYEGLNLLQPPLYHRYMIDLALVCSGVDLDPLFRVVDSVEGAAALGRTHVLSSGMVTLNPLTPVDGRSEAKFAVQFRVPSFLPSNLAAGRIEIEFPKNAVEIVGAAFTTPNPDTTATASIAGPANNVVNLEFSDSTGYAAGALVTLAELTLRTGVAYGGDFGRGQALAIRTRGNWVTLAAGDVTAYFRGGHLTVVTELR